MIHRIGDRRATAQAVPLPPSLEVGACYRYCEALCRAHHHNFPVASIFARSNLRQHIFAIFAFARVADDFADEPAYEGRRARELDRWEELLHQTYFGKPPEHPVFVALAATIKTLALPITEFVKLVSGFRTDLETLRYPTWNDLRAYTREAAEPVGHLLLYIGGYRAPELHAFAADLATGLAFARLIQDMPADLARGGSTCRRRTCVTSASARPTSRRGARRRRSVRWCATRSRGPGRCSSGPGRWSTWSAPTSRSSWR